MAIISVPTFADNSGNNGRCIGRTLVSLLPTFCARFSRYTCWHCFECVFRHSGHSYKHTLIFSKFSLTFQAGKHAYELATSFARYITLDVILAFEIFAIAWIYCNLLRYQLQYLHILFAYKKGAHSLGKDLKTMLDSTCFWCFGHFLLFFNYLLPAIPIVLDLLLISQTIIYFNGFTLRQSPS